MNGIERNLPQATAFTQKEKDRAMFRVITANLNGIRSAARKGFFDWFGTQEADFVCVQELKCRRTISRPSSWRRTVFRPFPACGEEGLQRRRTLYAA